MKKISDQELQAKLLQLAEDGTRLYLKGSGGCDMPERFLQHYCAVKLMEEGFLAVAEVISNSLNDWHVQDDTFLDETLQGLFVDLLVYDPSEDGHPEHTDFRAVVEFKRRSWAIKSDLERTAKIIKLLKEHPKNASDAQAFGYVIAASEMFRTADDIETERNLAESFGYGPVTVRTYKDTIPAEGYGTYYGIAIGAAVTSTDASQMLAHDHQEVDAIKAALAIAPPGHLHDQLQDELARRESRIAVARTPPASVNGIKG